MKKEKEKWYWRGYFSDQIRFEKPYRVIKVIFVSIIFQFHLSILNDIKLNLYLDSLLIDPSCNTDQGV